jgi:hypothetical protein
VISGEWRVASGEFRREFPTCIHGKDTQQRVCALRNNCCELSTTLTRTINSQSQSVYATLAFWDKTDNTKTLVVATHGFVKKAHKVPPNEIARAMRLREKYLKNTK